MERVLLSGSCEIIFAQYINNTKAGGMIVFLMYRIHFFLSNWKPETCSGEDGNTNFAIAQSMVERLAIP